MGNKIKKSKKIKNGSVKTENDLKNNIKEENNKENNKEKTNEEISSSTIVETDSLKNIKMEPFLDYTIIKELGEGPYITVNIVKHNINGNIRIMKEIEKPTKQLNKYNELEIINEIKTLIEIDHPNIAKIFDFYSDFTKFYLITEYCEEGSLNDLITNDGPFEEMQASYIMSQIFASLNYCHKKEIIHRDLKLENILINKNDNGFINVKICDFGTSLRFNTDEIKDKIVGPIYYIAPEVFKKKYNSKCDLWSCGIILYILLTGVPPFGNEEDQIINEKIYEEQYDKNRLVNKSKECIDLIDKLLEKDPDKRISVEEALSHKWFEKNKIKEKETDINPEIIEELINNLKIYKKSSEIKEITLNYLINHHNELEEVNNSKKLFEIIDKKGSKKINKEELYNGLNEIYQNDKLKEDVDKIFENLNINNDTYLEYDEYIKASIDKSIFFKDDNLKLIFNNFDKDNKGEINIDDIYSIFSGDKLSKDNLDKIKEIIKMVSQNEKIKYEEFCKIIKSFVSD